MSRLPELLGLALHVDERGSEALLHAGGIQEHRSVERPLLGGLPMGLGWMSSGLDALHPGGRS